MHRGRADPDHRCERVHPQSGGPDTRECGGSQRDDPEAGAASPGAVSPAYEAREDYERWHIRLCCRCGRTAGLSANWAGSICRTCYDRAVHTHGRCPGCGIERLLPGRRADGVAICRDCAGITRNFTCAGCDTEAALLGHRRCERCTLTDNLTALLDDGTGQVRPELRALHAGLRAVDTAQVKNTLTWLARPQIATPLTALGRGSIPITHEALADQSNWRTATSVREILMHHGVLPTMDKHLALFQRWLTDRLSAIEEEAHRQIVERFAALPVGQRLGDGCRCRGPGGRDGAAAPTAESFALRRDEVRGGLADHAATGVWGPSSIAAGGGSCVGSPATTEVLAPLTRTPRTPVSGGRRR